jgi:hypothetical protein
MSSAYKREGPGGRRSGAGQSCPPGRDPGRRPEPSERSERGEQGLGRKSGAGPAPLAVVPPGTGHEERRA